MRHCGEQIKEAAVRAGSSPDALPVEQHLLLDSLTRDVVRNAKGGIVVEGAFLDYVLSDVEDCRLVKLVCLDAERIRRVVSRGSEHSIAYNSSRNCFLACAQSNLIYRLTQQLSRLRRQRDA